MQFIKSRSGNTSSFSQAERHTAQASEVYVVDNVILNSPSINSGLTSNPINEESNSGLVGMDSALFDEARDAIKSRND